MSFFRNCIFLVVLVVLNGCVLFEPLPRNVFQANKTNAPFDAIIVPGVPFDGEHWRATMKIRVHWSNYLYSRGLTKNIIYSGSAVYTPYVEAKIMRMYAKGLGIPNQHIFIEERAEHSTENLYYSYRIAKEQGFKNIALATDPFQSKNLRKFIKKYDLPITLLPIVLDTMYTINTYEPAINPLAAIRTNFTALPERETLRERLKGTLGKKIIWHPEDLKKRRFRRKYKNQMVDERN